MAQLVLKQFTCVERNDSDSDSPYFVVFTAHGNDAGVHMLLDPAWDDRVDENRTWNPHIVVPGSVSEKHLVLVALLEQDDGVDLTGDEFEAVRKRMLKRWQLFTSVQDPTKSAPIRTEMASLFRNAIDDNTSNDDLIAIKRLQIPKSGQPNHLDMTGIDSGYYKVQFATQ